jgi:hypothetical protein
MNTAYQSKYLTGDKSADYAARFDIAQLMNHNPADRYCICDLCEAKFRTSMVAKPAPTIAAVPTFHHIVVTYKTPANDGISLNPLLLYIDEEDEMLDTLAAWDIEREAR